MTKVAVVISGCGSLDGAEIFETVFTLLELDKNNADVKIFASYCQMLCMKKIRRHIFFPLSYRY